MFDYEKGNLPQCFNNYFSKVKGTHSYQTRMAMGNKLSLNMAVNTKTHGQNMFKYQGSRLWNSIKDLKFYHDNIKRSTFKKKYKKHLAGLNIFLFIGNCILRNSDRILAKYEKLLRNEFGPIYGLNI